MLSKTNWKMKLHIVKNIYSWDRKDENYYHKLFLESCYFIENRNLLYLFILMKNIMMENVYIWF